MRHASKIRTVVSGAIAMCSLAIAAPASAGGYVGVGSCGVSVGVSFSSGYYGSCNTGYYSGRWRSQQRLYGYRGVYRGNRGYCGPGRYNYRRSGYYVSYPRPVYVNYNNCGPTYYGGYSRGPGTYTRYGRVPDGYSAQPRYVETEAPARERMYAPRHNAIVLETQQSDTESAPARQPIVMDRAWMLLEAGRADRAMAYFSSQANADLTDGTPKVGYALSAALNGDQDLAIWAMRRAFRIDPAGAMEAPISDRISQRIENLAARYGRAEVSTDSAFMLASCRLLLGETELARLAIDDAVAFGDQSESAANVLTLVSPADMYGPEGDTEMADSEDGEIADDTPSESSVASR